MRLARSRFSPWSPLIVALLAADLFALWIWATRPPRIFSYLLGLPGSREEAPIPRLLSWATGKHGPRTPSGCIALFETGEFFFAIVFLAALLLLILMLVKTPRSAGPLWRRLSAPFSLAQALAVRFRVRTALAAIAVLGIYLGWEIHGWRTWRLRTFYVEQAARANNGENQNRTVLRLRQQELARISQEDRLPPADEVMPELGYFRTKAAVAAERAARRDESEREATELSATIAAYAERRRRYERAAANPWTAVQPEAPLPEPVRSASYWQVTHDYSRALAGYDELAQTYPDYVDARTASAWIRATCPDAQYRDGKLAVASATRACELTKWKDTGALAILAAACAEAGDFAQAVKWQKKVVAVTPPQDAKRYQERLDLYAAGKAYRQK